MSAQMFALKDIAVAVLEYLDVPSADTDILSSGASYALYVKAKRWANQAAQGLADVGPWPWLEKAFQTLTIPANAWLVDLPDDAHRLLSDPSYENNLQWGFQPLSIQDVQTLRAGTTGVGVPRGFALTFNASGTAWVVNHLYAPGDYVRPVAGDGSFRYECTVAGLSAPAVEPTWPTVLGATVVDNAATWTCRPALRPQLVIWPPADAATTAKIAYARLLPEMVNDADLVPIPANLHYLVLIGAEATGEEQYERNWGGGARQTFEAKGLEEFRKSSLSIAHRLPLAGHNHFPLDGGALDTRVVPSWIGPNP